MPAPPSRDQQARAASARAASAAPRSDRQPSSPASRGTPPGGGGSQRSDRAPPTRSEPARSDRAPPDRSVPNTRGTSGNAAGRGGHPVAPGTSDRALAIRQAADRATQNMVQTQTARNSMPGNSDPNMHYGTPDSNVSPLAREAQRRANAARMATQYSNYQRPPGTQAQLSTFLGRPGVVAPNTSNSVAPQAVTDPYGGMGKMGMLSGQTSPYSTPIGTQTPSTLNPFDRVFGDVAIDPQMPGRLVEANRPGAGVPSLPVRGQTEYKTPAPPETPEQAAFSKQVLNDMIHRVPVTRFATAYNDTVPTPQEKPSTFGFNETGQPTIPRTTEPNGFTPPESNIPTPRMKPTPPASNIPIPRQKPMVASTVAKATSVPTPRMKPSLDIGEALRALAPATGQPYGITPPVRKDQSRAYPSSSVDYTAHPDAVGVALSKTSSEPQVGYDGTMIRSLMDGIDDWKARQAANTQMHQNAPAGYVRTSETGTVAPVGNEVYASPEHKPPSGTNVGNNTPPVASAQDEGEGSDIATGLSRFFQSLTEGSSPLPRDIGFGNGPGRSDEPRVSRDPEGNIVNPADWEGKGFTPAEIAHLVTLRGDKYKKELIRLLKLHMTTSGPRVPSSSQDILAKYLASQQRILGESGRGLISI